ncbi:MAG: YCF48-related protein [Bacteroidales bacterium]|nr:YCF48-related protein [Bacteroidales bacterium]
MKTGILFFLLPLFYSVCVHAQWEWQNPLPQGNHLGEVCFINQSEGWAADYVGTIVHTTDGGQTWTAQNSSLTTTLWSVCFVDGNHGWAFGAQGKIISTGDGGQTWNIINI